jgi:hypothetical protein
MSELAALLMSAWLLAANAPEPVPSVPTPPELESGAFPSLASGLASGLPEPQAYGMQDLHGSGDPLPGNVHAWEPRVALMQGYFGAGLLDEIELTGGSLPDTDGSDESLSQFPVLGGGAQWKLAGERIDFGVEALLGFGWRADGKAFAVGGNGAAIAVEVDMLLVELYGGPFVSTFLGEHLRLYAAAGPEMQWINYDQSGPTGTEGDGDGFGTGFYARTGLEFVASPDMLIGVGVRWVDTTADMSGDLGDLDMQGYQAVVTFSRI